MEEAQVVQEGKERILIVAVDFDGCMGHSVFKENYKRRMKELPDPSTPEQREAVYKAVIQESNAALVKDIVQRSQDHDRVVVIVGSNRQSANKDREDGKKNNNGSCFEATAALAKVLGEQLKKPVELDKYVIFDSVLELPAGSNFDLRDQERTPIFDNYTTSIDKKYRLAYFQMQRVCGLNPNASVSYVHYDDREDIVIPTVKAFRAEKGEHLPPNLTSATACHYELYNPYSNLQTLSATSRALTEKNPTGFVDQRYIAQLIAALDMIYKTADFLEHTIPNHQDEINKIAEQKEALIEERNQYTRGSNEYSKTTQKILNLERQLGELEKPKKIKEVVEEARRKLREHCGDDLPNCQLTQSQFNSLITEAEKKLTNNNVQTKYLDIFPNLKKDYEAFLAGIEGENVNEMGQFNRTVEVGHQIQMVNFDRTVKECMADAIVDRTDSYALLVQEESRIQQVASIEAQIESLDFNSTMISSLDPAIFNEAHDRCLDTMKKQFISGEINLATLNARLDIMGTKPEDKLVVLQELFDQVTDSNNTNYKPPRNPVVRFLKGLVGKGNYSSERLGHITQLQEEYLKIAQKNKDNDVVKKHVASSTLPDYETRHAYLGINHATQCRKQLMALYDDDPSMTIQQLFTLSTESDSPFKAKGLGGFIATALLGAKRRLASFTTEQISEYIAINPKHAPSLLAAYKDDLARNPQTIYRLLKNPELHDAVKESKLLDSKYLDPKEKKKLSDYMKLIIRGAPPSFILTPPEGKDRPPQPTISAAEAIRKGRPAPPPYTAPSRPPSQAPVRPTEGRSPMPTTSPIRVPAGNRPPPPSHTAPPPPSNPASVTPPGERPPQPATSPTPAPAERKAAPAHNDPSDEAVEQAMKVLDRVASSPRPEWAQGSSGTESKDTEASETPPSSEDESKGPSNE